MRDSSRPPEPAAASATTRGIARLSAIVLLWACSPSAASTPDGQGPAAGPVAGGREQVAHRVVTVVDDLSNPWSVTWLPNGDMLVTERPGRLRIVRDGALLRDPVEGVPEVVARGQGGPARRRAASGLLDQPPALLSYARPRERAAPAPGWCAGVRERRSDRRGADLGRAVPGPRPLRIAPGLRRRQLPLHHRGRPAGVGPGRAGRTVGTSGTDLSNHNGVVVRLHDDGRIPADNPFVGREGVLEDIYSYGHRNPQGLAFHPETGDLWLNEHGPQGGDEVNVVLPGRNYGWPVVGHGVNYGSGSRIHVGTHREGMEPPVHYWVPSIATSGMLVYTATASRSGAAPSSWADWPAQQLARLTLDGRTVVSEETWSAHGPHPRRAPRPGRSHLRPSSTSPAWSPVWSQRAASPVAGRTTHGGPPRAQQPPGPGRSASGSVRAASSCCWRSPWTRRIFPQAASPPSRA